MGEVKDTGWRVAACGPGRVRSLTADTGTYNCHALGDGRYTVRRGLDALASLDSPDAQIGALADAVNWILRDELAAGAPGDVPEWAARLASGQPVRLEDAGIAPGIFGPFPPYHYP